MRIFDFAKVAEWDSHLNDLAGLAEKERWTYRKVPDPSPVPILDSYAKHTFARLSEQGQLAITDRAACFNTGLLTPSQEEIFGLFRVSDRYDPSQPPGVGNKKWFFTGWARAGDRVLTALQTLPTLATYWSDPSELVLNPNLRIELNVDHIVRENLSRFPVELGGRLAGDGIPGDLDDSEEPAPVAVDAPVPLATRNALEGSLKHSIRLAQRSYRVAVPQFYWGRIQLLLPIYLRSADAPDLAVTLEKHGDWYRAATVLYPDWAYRHARLLARPNSEWLGGFRTDLAEAQLG